MTLMQQPTQEIHAPYSTSKQSIISQKPYLQLFAEHARKNSDKTVIVHNNIAISYAELDKKSDQVASYLRIHGIKANDLVGLCASLNTDFIVCMLGILKAGAGYFPLDPDYPQDRLQYMMQDAKPKLVLVESQYSTLFKDIDHIPIDQNILEYPIQEREIYDREISPDDLAYVIYTSGSTGNPKGIMVSHGSLPNIAIAHRDYYPAKMRMLLAGGVCFDASLLVIFHALVNNCDIFLYNPQDSGNLGLLDFIQTNSINYLISIPSQYSKLLQNNIILPSLKCVSLTGENLPVNLCHLHEKFAPNAFLYNEFGPTECAIGTTIAEIYNPKSYKLYPVTVGKPLPNTSIYILDENLNFLPNGSKGEICISGSGLARGYINNKSLTNEKFFLIETSNKELVRIYRTGDIGRILPNGNLEFLGRVEHYSKIGQHLINLGELEYHISQHPAIQEAAILVQDSLKDEKELVVYFIGLQNTAEIALTQLITSLIPASSPFTLIRVDNFPYSPNGKIDRTALLNKKKD